MQDFRFVADFLEENYDSFAGFCGSEGAADEIIEDLREGRTVEDNALSLFLEENFDNFARTCAGGEVEAEKTIDALRN